MYKIGIISDTHEVLREEAIAHLKECHYILHAGDITSQKTLDQLKKIVPFTVVRGNNDKGEWAEDLPKDIIIEKEGLVIYMVHESKDIRKDIVEGREPVDVVITGHSHKYKDEMDNGIRYLNPGGCGPRRFTIPITMMILTIESHKRYSIQKITIYD